VGVRDRDEFEAFFRASFVTVRRSLALIVGDTDAADDAAEEAFARAFARWWRVRKMDSPIAWTVTVGLNVVRSARSRTARLNSLIPKARRDENEFAPSSICALDLAPALRELPPRQRTAVVLRYFADMPLSEIALSMSCAEGTVKSTLNAALTNLRVKLAEDQGDDDEGS
jgi:RNA polymerase sigma-70 factor (ECF subfamily)